MSPRSAIRLLTAVVVLAVGLGPAPTAGATVPGEDGRVAFASRKDTFFFDIYTSRPDGSDERRVTTGGGHREPAWSPDGRRLAFSYRVPGFSEIDVGTMNADGTNLVVLTTTGADREPTWSPDGARIAFTSERDGGDREIYVMDADGSDQTRLTTRVGTDENPSWSPDGLRIAYVRDGDIWVMDADGTDPVNLSNNVATEGDPAWSPDGSQIAFTRSMGGGVDHVWRMSAANGSAQVDLSGANSDSAPAWSPRGDRIVAACARDDGMNLFNERCVMNTADGSGRAFLAENSWDEFDLDWQTAVPRPDALVRRGTGTTKGNGTYRTSVVPQQQVEATAGVGTTVTYHVTVQNDGTTEEPLRIQGLGSTNRFRVRYTSGGQVITNAVVAGTHQTPALAPGQSRTVTVEVTVLAAAPRGASLSRAVTVRSTLSPTIRDLVGTVTRRP